MRFIKSQDFLCKPCNHAVNLKVLVIKKFKAEALVLDENRFVERRVSKVHGFGLFAKMQIRKEDLRLPYLGEKITAIERDLR